MSKPANSLIPTRALGKTGLQVSMLGFGGGHIAREGMSEAESIRLLQTAIDARKAGKVRFIGFTAHKSPHIVKKMLSQDFPWDTVQMPVTVMDPGYRSFIREILPLLNERGIACIGMKSLGGEGQFVNHAKLSAQECRRFAFSQPISTLVTGMESLENVAQDVGFASNFVPMSETEQQSLLESVHKEAGDGRHEWYKSTQFYDSPCHRKQHGFPPIGHVNTDQTINESD